MVSRTTGRSCCCVDVRGCISCIAAGIVLSSPDLLLHGVCHLCGNLFKRSELVNRWIFDSHCLHLHTPSLSYSAAPCCTVLLRHRSVAKDIPRANPARAPTSIPKLIYFTTVAQVGSGSTTIDLQLHRPRSGRTVLKPVRVGTLRNHNLVVAICPHPLTRHHFPVISVCRHVIPPPSKDQRP